MRTKSLLTALLVGLVLWTVGCRQSSAPQQAVATAAEPSPAQPESQAPDGGEIRPAEVRFFKGSIGSALGLQMKLIRDRETVTGNYFYKKVGTRIELKGSVDKDGNLVLEEFDQSGKSTGVFKGIWKTDESGHVNIVGNWSKPNSQKLTAFSLHQEPVEFTGTTEIVAKQIKEKSKTPKYEIDAEYPQITGAAGGGFDKFNQASRSLVARRVAQFKKDMADKVAEEASETEIPELGSDLGVGYSIGIARDDLISVEFDIGGYYAGAAHPNSYTEVLNFDLKNGKALRLADLFKPGAKYLQLVSTYSINDLKAQAKSKGPDSMLSDDTIRSGAGPDPKNFKSWTITPKGLSLTFDAYQVAPYAAGPQNVLIPYSALKDIIRSDGPLAGFVK
ncbi:MAG TPA: DUF3298 and DUF4163 domain-containing protein [Pyrinomonadaceae bacterium]|nr:DUF3298 and DUF4163 domain-containing protein [Pyrinomonadaceae bacterium]